MNNKQKKLIEARKQRIIARGEHSNHAHIISGDDVVIREEAGTIFVSVGNSGAVLKHILESQYIESGQEIWTKEHTDIQLDPGEYEFVPQLEYNPLDETIQQVKD